MHKVLVIDSNPASAKGIVSSLTKSGFEVMVASSESAGLKIKDKTSPDAVVVRDDSTQLEGFKLCKTIRNLFDLPLILLCDKSEEEVYSPDLNVPTDWDYYMHLPISYGELAARIKVLLWRYGKGEKPGSSEPVVRRSREATESRILNPDYLEKEVMLIEEA
jgi:DNA-binding response OmpR family regulator